MHCYNKSYTLRSMQKESLQQLKDSLIQPKYIFAILYRFFLKKTKSTAEVSYNRLCS